MNIMRARRVGMVAALSFVLSWQPMAKCVAGFRAYSDRLVAPFDAQVQEANFMTIPDKILVPHNAVDIHPRFNRIFPFDVGINGDFISIKTKPLLELSIGWTGITLCEATVSYEIMFFRRRNNEVFIVGGESLEGQRGWLGQCRANVNLYRNFIDESGAASEILKSDGKRRPLDPAIKSFFVPSLVRFDAGDENRWPLKRQKGFCAQVGGFGAFLGGVSDFGHFVSRSGRLSNMIDRSFDCLLAISDGPSSGAPHAPCSQPQSACEKSKKPRKPSHPPVWTRIPLALAIGLGANPVMMWGCILSDRRGRPVLGRIVRALALLMFLGGGALMMLLAFPATWGWWI